MNTSIKHCVSTIIYSAVGNMWEFPCVNDFMMYMWQSIMSALYFLKYFCQHSPILEIRIAVCGIADRNQKKNLFKTIRHITRMILAGEQGGGKPGPGY